MPVMDGLTLLSELRARRSPARAVIVSAYGDMQNIRTAMNRGAFDFVTKPVDLTDLEVTIDKTLQTIADIRELERRIQAVEKKNSSGEVRAIPEAPIGVPDSFEEHMRLMFDIQALAFAAGEPIPLHLPAETLLFTVPAGLLRIFDRDLKMAGIPKKDERGRTALIAAAYQNHLEVGQALIDAGADAVVGTHPHVTQDIENYRGKPIIYSLGNFVFDGFTKPEELTGWLLSLEVSRQGVQQWRIHTARLDARGTPRPVD